MSLALILFLCWLCVYVAFWLFHIANFLKVIIIENTTSQRSQIYVAVSKLHELKRTAVLNYVLQTLHVNFSV